MNFFARYDTFVKIFLLLVVLLVVGNLVLVDRRLFLSESKIDGGVLDFASGIVPESVCGDDCKRVVEEKVSGAILKLLPPLDKDECGDGCEKAIDEKVSEVFSKLPKSGDSKKINTGLGVSYIPVGTDFSSTAVDWTDVKGGEVYIDIADYGLSPTFSWDVSLKIANASGEARTRLFDVTNGIAVSGSELSVASSDYTTVSSGDLPFWRGRNLYRVQIKSTTSQSVSFASGRIKVVAK